MPLLSLNLVIKEKEEETRNLCKVVLESEMEKKSTLSLPFIEQERSPEENEKQVKEKKKEVNERLENFNALFFLLPSSSFK